MFIFEKVGHSKFVEMHGDTSDYFRSASKSDRYFFLLMGFTYDFYANRWRMCSISYYFRNSSASINNVTNVNYDIDLQKMYMYSCKMPQMVCLTR